MDSRGFDLVIADMPGANRLTLHVLAAAEHERAHTPASSSVIQSKARINRAKAAEQAQALRPHLERCIEAGRALSSAIAADLNARGIAAPNGGPWFTMQVSRARRRLGLTVPATY